MEKHTSDRRDDDNDNWSDVPDTLRGVIGTYRATQVSLPISEDEYFIEYGEDDRIGALDEIRMRSRTWRARRLASLLLGVASRQEEKLERENSLRDLQAGSGSNLDTQS